MLYKKEQEEKERIKEESCLENEEVQKEDSKVTNISEQYKPDQVYRFPLRDTELNSLIMKLPAIDECWKLPRLCGETHCIELGNKGRFDYLHELNERLMLVDDENMKEQIIDEAIYYLEEMLDAKRWI